MNAFSSVGREVGCGGYLHPPLVAMIPLHNSSNAEAPGGGGGRVKAFWLIKHQAVKSTKL